MKKTSSTIAIITAILTFLGLIYQVVEQAIELRKLFQETQQLKQTLAGVQKDLESVNQREDALRSFVVESEEARSTRGTQWGFDRHHLKWRPLMREGKEAPK